MKILCSLRRQAGMFTRGLSRLAGAEESARPRSVGARASLSRGDQGGALIEIALTVPVLLGVLTGICTFGIAFSNQLTLTQAVGSGGQYLSQIRTTTTNPCADTFTAIKNAAPNLTSSKISVTVTMNGTTPSQSGNTCPGDQTDLVQGGPVSVSATYPCALNTMPMFGNTLLGSCQLQAKVTEYEY